MLVTHTSKNLKELSKCQTLNVKGFYNVNDNQKVFAEIDPIGRAISGIGLKLKQVRFDRRWVIVERESLRHDALVSYLRRSMSPIRNS
mmetsp:Transcript_30416/g.116604  ORF Transcript_30416/g.116604 Transcript_30416/m.116604 type:complete len:88 (-) Transcript_30416:694-957(-)